MNTTYLVLSVPFLAIGAGLTGVAVWKFELRLRSLGIPVALLVGATAVFDNLIIWSGLVAYDEERILGIRIGLAPVEDFLYAIAAVLVTASVWQLLGRRSPQ